MEDDVLTIDDIANHVTRRGAYDGVRIREFDDGTVNPEPVKRDDDEESDNLWEEFLSPNKLVRTIFLSFGVDFILSDLNCKQSSASSKSSNIH